jgi:putative restriction endonuclease
MFDRGLLSLGPPPDYQILLSEGGLPINVRRLFNSDMKLGKPGDERLWPAPAYIEYHRQNIFNPDFPCGVDVLVT